MIAFFALVFVLTLPFWLMGAVLDVQLMPGLPFSSLMVVCPALAALILRWRAFGGRRAVRFLSRAVDVWRWRSPALIMVLLLINPVIYAASYVVQSANGVGLPPPNIQIGPLLALFSVFLLAAICEELGWTGHALGPLQRRWGMLGAGLILGLLSAFWHYVALAQAERSFEWVAWWTLGTVATRVLIVWLYNETGRSVFAIAVFHALSNVSWQLYPVEGSFFDPRMNALITVLLVIVLVRPWRRGFRRRMT